MQPTMQLIELQTYLISKGKSMIDERGYKSTPDVLKMIAELWNKADRKEREYIENLIAWTDYSKINKENI